MTAATTCDLFRSTVRDSGEPLQVTEASFSYSARFHWEITSKYKHGGSHKNSTI